ncbi:unnamed protein product [Caenorhabditis auriculariae]|uniref:Homeobox domain-containing protein n=1 Tax=Caenorhabditis auriculariae TaxID=2777116 RepID=A0A8S1GSU1_9PELO|nr:unnamed protein product [Caenorhabditis auriculariae]
MNSTTTTASLNGGFDFSTAATSTTSASSTATPPQPDPNDHLQRLAAMTQGVGKEDPESSTTSSAEAALYPAAYMHGYAAGWPNYYQNFGQPLAPTPFPTWPQCYAGPAWPNYATSKKGRQTYQRYQTSVLEAKFQQSSYVSKKQREELRLQTQLTDRQIKIWFQNRRMKAKKEKQRVEEHSDHTPLLPANPPKSMEHVIGGGGGGGMAGAGLMSSLEEEKKWQMAAAAAAHWPAPPHYQYPLCPP